MYHGNEARTLTSGFLTSGLIFLVLQYRSSSQCLIFYPRGAENDEHDLSTSETLNKQF